jgi:hypothetical protein
MHISKKQYTIHFLARSAIPVTSTEARRAREDRSHQEYFGRRDSFLRFTLSWNNKKKKNSKLQDQAIFILLVHLLCF